MPNNIHPDRVRVIKDAPAASGPVLYWMSREQRLEDNWALFFAREAAVEKKTPLYIIFCLVPEFLNAGPRQYAFMLRGLKELSARARQLNIGFLLRRGEPGKTVHRTAAKLGAGQLILESDPLKLKRKWQKQVLNEINIKTYEIDARNIVPWWIASQKQEYSARTIRPRLSRLLPSFLHPFPELKRHPFTPAEHAQEEPDLSMNFSAGAKLPEIKGITPGAAAAKSRLNEFIKTGLTQYDRYSNNPNKNILSQLSPYIHFGQISAQKVALRIRESGHALPEARQNFLEQVIIRRELAENFCAYNPNYDSLRSAPNWARETLKKHANDPRPFTYSLREFENGLTHDPLWNAAQIEMTATGKMHGYMRMYWAKKILEWTPAPENALEYAIYLNDRYELDGRDPNGYAGIMWSIGGIHDQGWKERPVFGKIRYMSYTGCKRKFRIGEYIDRVKASAQHYGIEAPGLEYDKL
ncbi:MAG: deoxyribodipyrimidine photo-lyase [Thermodesulfobacteriota bacterium]